MAERSEPTGLPASGPPVVYRLHSGLGNQLFEFAAAYAVARRLDAPLRHDPYKSEDRALALCIGLFWQPATHADLARAAATRTGGLDRWRGAARRRAWTLGERLGRSPHRFALPEASEASEAFAYDPRFERLVAPCYLRGYFQDLGYFDTVLDDVVEILIDNLQIPPPDPRGSVVALQFRVADEYRQLGWTLAEPHYAAALEVVAAEIADPMIRVLCDDDTFRSYAERWAVASGFVVDDSPRPEQHPDPVVNALIEAARCNHGVMSNSTFSWWGAVLGDHLSGASPRLVVYPSGWVGQPAHLARSTWRVLPSTLNP